MIDFQLTDEQKMLQEMAYNLAKEKFQPKAFSWEERSEFPLENIKILADHGLLGITLPEEYGGGGRSLIDVVIVIEEIGRICPDTVSIINQGNLGPISAIGKYGAEEQKRKYLPAIIRGEKMICIAITEPEAGSASTDLMTRAIEKNDTFIVNGTKQFISRASVSEIFLTWVRFDQEKGSRGIGAIIIEKGMPGFSLGKVERNLGGGSFCQLFFEDCIVPKENVLVKEDGFKRLMATYNENRIGNATTALSLARCAFEMALKYSQERKQFGREICEFQGIQWMLADMAIKLDAARLLIYRAAVNAGKGFPSPLESSIAKTFAAEMAQEVTSIALQIHGGYGYSKEFPLEQLYRKARGNAISGGTVQIQRNRIASMILGRSFTQRKR